MDIGCLGCIDNDGRRLHTCRDHAFQKHDKEKFPWTRFPWRAADAIAGVLMFGAAKYGWDNWRKADMTDNERYLDAAMRHLISVSEGEIADPESELHHVSHAACSLLFYLDNLIQHQLDEVEATRNE